jgi:hypothetical protein
MNRKVMVVVAASLFVLFIAASSNAAVFVATVKNFRGALYQGAGPTPAHASEMAIVKCSQDSFAPRSCKVLCVRMDCPQPMCAPPMRKPISKARVGKVYPAGYWGRPMP